MNKSISIVIPVFRSGDILDELYRRLQDVLSGITDQWEIILVDDASNDGTYIRMQEIRARDNRVKLIRFARNMGQQHATLCGIQHAVGSYVLTLDDDLQNPPEEIPRFIEKINEGYDLVIGDISGNKQHHWFRNFASHAMQIMVSHILNKPKHLVLSSFRGMSKRAAISMASFKGTHVYIPALMLTSVPPDRICNIPVQHNTRAIGKSTYTLRKLIRITSYLLINHSRIPLRFVTTWGIMISMASFGYALFVAIKYLLYGSKLVGWSSQAILISFLSGNILFCIGILGEYIGRIVDENVTSRQFPIFEEHF
jgi:undecaprenyl-phosphate 4-deoxy-4-formamido-L-arabinose transferase